LIYHPSGQNIGVYELQTGKKIHSLRGHFDNVMCCEFHPELQELYSGAADASMLVWSPAMDELGITQVRDSLLRIFPTFLTMTTCMWPFFFFY
jgi:WD40 repeat protein